LDTLADSTPISALMSSDVCCVRPDVSIQALAALLIEGGLSGVPVVDERGQPIGVVSQTDLVRHHYESGTAASHQPPSTVVDIMTDVSFTLDEGASVSQAAALMALEGVDRVPVVDPRGQLVGILSSFDVLYWLACETGYVVDVVRSFLSKP
jgi:CBS domain-containing protein